MKLRLLSLLCSVAALAAEPVPANLFNQLQWRLIGPFRGGRVAAVTGVPGDPVTFYFGSVGGGVWKTTDAGTVWSPIFDQQRIASIGAIAVAASNPNILYVGTGEADIRSQIGFGDGVYKSTDAGRTWTNIGLRDTRQIACIRVDPRNPDLVYVAALGHVYGPNAERGVFRSADGGRSWQKVLDRGPDVGATDLAFDPGNSKVIYATVWNARRSVWSQYAPIEGAGSGLFKTTDGGDHWSQLSGHGLPENRWGRSGVAVAAGGRRVYALIDAPNAGIDTAAGIDGPGAGIAASASGLYRSDDSGETWTRSSSDNRITSRNWYFSGITVDPKDPDLVYVPNVAVYRSTDGGRNFTVLKGAPGGDDYRILWVDPADTNRMVLGSDQGTNVSLDKGKTWSTWYNQPTAQMYHVVTDNQFPYSVYGSQQDSGTAAVYSRTDHGEIDARDWYSVGGAESGYIAVDPRNQHILYVGNTNGALVRFDKRTGQSQNITPWPVRGDRAGSISAQKYRYPWTAPLVFSASEPDTLYFGSQYLMKTTDGGLTWHEISADLTGDTRKDTRAAAPSVGENRPVTADNARELGYGVIYTIAPSPLKAGMVWVGSDTGLIHLTRDAGKTWQSVTPPGLSAWSKVTQIEASHFDPAVAYAAVDRHRVEDYKPYVYRTRDYGKTWTLVTEGLHEPAYLNSIKEDPGRKGLLYAATELDVAVSFDDGGHWQSLQLNLPTVSVRDLAIHGDDLVAATFGRGFWILDDIAPLRQIDELRQMDEKAAASEAFLFKPATAIRMNPEGFFGSPFPPEEPKAKNPPEGALIDYFLKAATPGEVTLEITLEILDGKNQVVRRFSSEERPAAPSRPGAIADIWIVPPAHLTAKPGMNRFAWDLRYAAPGADDSDAAEFGRAQGPQVLPGTYQARLTVAGGSAKLSYTQPFKVTLDPRSTATPVELEKKLSLCLSIAAEMGKAADAARDASTLRRLLADRRQAANGALVAKIAALDLEVARIAGGGGGGRGGRGGGGGRGGRAGPASATPNLRSVSSLLGAALSVAESADRTPPGSAYEISQQATRDLAALMANWRTLRDAKLAELNRELQQNKLPVIDLPAIKLARAVN
ncbi:MAG TPA: hypothetical protein VNY05_09365 [Candidatus Acidoferrales bacterium]|nr:hypothetical protein [Candidatus Acidoferrales bacterium]